MSVELHIDTLVVDGRGAADPEVVRAALTAELETLVEGAGAPARAAIDVVDAGVLPVARGGAPQLGRALARSIHRSVWPC